MSRKTKPGNVRFSKVASTPLITFIKKRSKTHDKYSKRAQNITKISKYGGLIILDAHQNALDIFASAASVAKISKFNNIILPVTAYDYFFPFTGLFLDKIQKDDLLNIFPVFRYEETLFNNWNRIKKPFFPNDINGKDLNRSYLKMSTKALKKPQNIVVVSPYGGIKPLGSKIRSGVNKLLKTGAPTICTWTKFSFKNMRYETSISTPIHFNAKSTDEYIRETITLKFRQIHYNN